MDLGGAILYRGGKGYFTMGNEDCKNGGWGAYIIQEMETHTIQVDRFYAGEGNCAHLLKHKFIIITKLSLSSISASFRFTGLR